MKPSLRTKPWIVTGLSELPVRSLVDMGTLTAMFRCSKVTINAMIRKRDLPKPIRIGGHRVWMVGRIINHINTRMIKAEGKKVSNPDADREIITLDGDGLLDAFAKLKIPEKYMKMIRKLYGDRKHRKPLEYYPVQTALGGKVIVSAGYHTDGHHPR